MAQAIKLEAQKRADRQGNSNDKLRRSGLIPAIVYGSGSEPISIQVKTLDFERVYAVAKESSLIDLILDGKAIQVLVKDFQQEIVKNVFTHVDFYKVDMKKKVTTMIPLVFVGEAKAVRELGGYLVTEMDELEIECLPSDLPHDIKVDISSLNTFDDLIRVSDIKMPKGVEATADGEDAVISVSAPRAAEEQELKAEADAAAAANAPKVAPTVKETKEAKK